MERGIFIRGKGNKNLVSRRKPSTPENVCPKRKPETLLMENHAGFRLESEMNQKKNNYWIRNAFSQGLQLVSIIFIRIGIKFKYVQIVAIF